MLTPPLTWHARGAAALALALLAGCANLAPPAAPEQPGVTEAGTAAPAAALPPAPPAQPAPPAVAELPPAQSERLHTPARSQGDLWQRLRDGYAMPDLDNALVRQWEQWYARRPDYVARMTERGSRYLFHVVEALQERGLPTELALLPFVESAFNPNAVSSASAAGMWQFIPSTGRAYDLKQNHFRDERRDVLASTEAALNYLQMLHGMFDDWHLALAAYNWGEGSVKRALQRARVGGGPGVYERLRMPAETRNYVPKLQALKNIVARPEAFGLSLPALPDAPQFLSVAIERDLDIELAAELAGMSIERFLHFNPQHDKPVILAAGSPQVLLPYDQANRFVRELAAYPGRLASWTAWVAPRTMTPAQAAALHELDEDELRRLNGIPQRMQIRQGSTLIVPRPQTQAADVPAHLADHARLVLAPDQPMRKLVVRAPRRGTSVKAIAYRYRLPSGYVAELNGVAPEARFKSGQRIVVMVPAGKSAGKKASSRASSGRPTPSKRPAR